MEPLTSYRKELRTLRAETFFLLGDPNQERFNILRVVEKLNEACLTYCLESQLIKEEINIQLESSQFEYDIKEKIKEAGTLRDYGFPLRVGYDGPNEPAVLPGSLLSIDLKGWKRDIAQMPCSWYLDAVSPGKIQILGPPQADGSVPPLTTGNIQVRYVAMPIPMIGEYILGTNGEVLLNSLTGQPLEPVPATVFSYPDSIPTFFHRYLPYGAAYLLLEEGDKNDLLKAAQYEDTFYRGMIEQVAEEYRARTQYDDMRPM